MKLYSTSFRLNQIMKDRNLKQIDILNLAEPYCQMYKIKLGKSDLSQFVSGKVEPGESKLTVLALALQVSEVWLKGYDVPPERGQLQGENTPKFEGILPLPQTKKVPLLGIASSGEPIFIEKNQQTHIDLPVNINADFAFKLKDSSLINLNLNTDDIIFGKFTENIENGRLAVVSLNKEILVKRVYIAQNSIILQGESHNCQPIVLSENNNNFKIIGKAIACISLLENK